MQRTIQLAEEIVDFWQEAGSKRWFAKSDEFDEEIRHRYGALIDEIAQGELESWQDTAIGMMALILIIDQFSRNIFRNSPRAFALDDKARKLTETAVERGFDDAFELPMKRFMYMPYMHAEDMIFQKRLLQLCRQNDDAAGIKHGEIHADIIRRFGRFPHRNKVLGRETSPEEQEFLDKGGFSG